MNDFLKHVETPRRVDRVTRPRNKRRLRRRRSSIAKRFKGSLYKYEGGSFHSLRVNFLDLYIRRQEDWGDEDILRERWRGDEIRTNGLGWTTFQTKFLPRRILFLVNEVASSSSSMGWGKGLRCCGWKGRKLIGTSRFQEIYEKKTLWEISLLFPLKNLVNTHSKCEFRKIFDDENMYVLMVHYRIVKVNVARWETWRRAMSNVNPLRNHLSSDPPPERSLIWIRTNFLSINWRLSSHSWFLLFKPNCQVSL